MSTQLLPKGFKVMYKILDVSHYGISGRQLNINNRHLEGISYTPDWDKCDGLWLEGFVAGDDGDKLSVLSIDNPEECLVQQGAGFRRSTHEEDIKVMRKLLWRGYLVQDEFRDILGYHTPPYSHNITCPFNGDR